MRLGRAGLLLVWISACSGGAAGATGGADRAAPREHGEASSGEAAHPVEEVAATEVVEHAPELELAAEVDPYGRVSLAIRNRGSEAQTFSPQLVLEHEDAERFAPAERGPFSLGSEFANAEGCVELAPGGELTGSWSCLNGESEGLVRDCTLAPSGRYRFVAQSCHGGMRTEAEPFSYPQGR